MSDRSFLEDATPLEARLAGGLAGGLAAGTAMALFAMIRAAWLGAGFWLPMKEIAAFFWGVDALIGGTGVVVIGILVHLAVAGGAGLLFGLLFGSRLSSVGAMVIGMLYAIAIWGFMTWIFLPHTDGTLYHRQMVSPSWWFVYNLAFGACLLLVPPLTRAFGRRIPSAV